MVNNCGDGGALCGGLQTASGRRRLPQTQSRSCHDRPRRDLSRCQSSFYLDNRTPRRSSTNCLFNVTVSGAGLPECFRRKDANKTRIVAQIRVAQCSKVIPRIGQNAGPVFATSSLRKVIVIATEEGVRGFKPPPPLNLQMFVFEL